MNELCDKLESIKKPYAIIVEQISESLDFNIEYAKNQIKKWLIDDSIRADSSYVYENQLLITVLNVDTSKEHIIFMFKPNTPKVHPSKIKSDIIKKLESYNNSIIKNHIPFFVGIDLTFDTGLQPKDYLYFFKAKPSISNFSVLGEFYIDNKLNGLAGILISFNNGFYWLNNPINPFQINFQNTESDFIINPANASP